MAAWQIPQLATRQMCGDPRAVSVDLIMIGVPYDALTGGYGLAWQVVSWGVIAPLFLVGLLAWVVLLDRRFGWGLAGSLPDPAPTTSADEVGVLDGD